MLAGFLLAFTQTKLTKIRCVRNEFRRRSVWFHAGLLIRRALDSPPGNWHPSWWLRKPLRKLTHPVRMLLRRIALRVPRIPRPRLVPDPVAIHLHQPRRRIV